ncbi:hypothetical protein A7P96_09605 [Eikenella sp. NML03-A-027]|nr:hypothetical protein A7P96_09605 [Eikenella sp. NML03-A-027]
MQQRKRGQPLEVTQKIVASKALGVASATTCEAEKDCTQNAANRRSCKTAGAEDDGFEQKKRRHIRRLLGIGQAKSLD